MYPVIFLIPQPERTSRLKMIFRGLLIIPVAFFAGLYSIPASFVLFAAFFIILVTGRFPRSMWEYTCRYVRFSNNLNAYYMLLTDVYPPLNGREETPYPIRTGMDYPERMSRLAVLFRGLILLPHYFYCLVYAIGYMFVAFIVWWAVLFTGRIPSGMFGFLKRFFVYSSRLNAYLSLIVDEYPPFNGHQPQSVEDRLQGHTA